jgi:hypothetical protein
LCPLGPFLVLPGQFCGGSVLLLNADGTEARPGPANKVVRSGAELVDNRGEPGLLRQDRGEIDFGLDQALLRHTRLPLPAGVLRFDPRCLGASGGGALFGFGHFAAGLALGLLSSSCAAHAFAIIIAPAQMRSPLFCGFAAFTTFCGWLLANCSRLARSLASFVS